MQIGHTPIRTVPTAFAIRINGLLIQIPSHETVRGQGLNFKGDARRSRTSKSFLIQRRNKTHGCRLDQPHEAMVLGKNGQSYAPGIQTAFGATSVEKEVEFHPTLRETNRNK